MTIHQDVDLYASLLESGKQVTLDGVADRRVFIQVVSGELRINGELVGAGDGMQIRQEDSVNITALSESEFLLFNLS